MGGTHKKKLRAEKAKVKLKGAKLPKGLNVTKTEFKVRKITLREQLKEAQFVDGLRQVNLKDTLSKLKHHSSNARSDALRVLRDAVAMKHPGITGSLSEIIQGIAAVCLDQEREARRESHKTLAAFLNSLSIEAVAPFFHIISSYLRCAMTHIQPNIQEDSLLLLDVLLQHIPHLVAVHSNKILQNFLEMISRIRADGDKAGRVLTVNLGQTQTTIKWRSKVLLRLQQMLSTLTEFKRQQSETVTSANSKNINTASYSTKKAQYVGLKRSFDNSQSCDLSHIFSRAMCASTTLGEENASDESEHLKLYVDHLMPLLLESWLEVRPHHSGGGSSVETLLTPDAALTLKIILEVIENLWTLIQLYEDQVSHKELSLWFKQQYAEVFAANFLQSSYPFRQTENCDGGNSKKRGKQSSGPSPYCLHQNIMVGYLMCRFFSQDLQSKLSKFNAVLSYMNSVLNSIANDGISEFMYPLTDALRALLLDCGIALMNLHPDATTQVLRSCIKAFLDNKFGDVVISSKILIMLCEIIQNHEVYKAYGGSEFNDFLQYLPNLLLKPAIHVACLVAMSKLGKQQNEIFLNSLRMLLVQILQQLQNIQVTGAHNVFEGKKHILNLFYWLNPQKSLSQTDLTNILQFLDSNITDRRVVNYCTYILTLA